VDLFNLTPDDVRVLLASDNAAVFFASLGLCSNHPLAQVAAAERLFELLVLKGGLGW
jgi:hypothetical protein